MVIIPGLMPASGLATATPRRRVRQDGSGFEVPDGDGLPPAAPAAAASALPGLLAMQEAAVAGAGDRAARSHAEAVLQELGSFQLALLRGQPGAAASRLADLARAAPRTFNPRGADPRLADVLRAIRLRAEVEAARGAMVRQPTVRRQGDT